jgi:hypothetical protein
MDTVREIFDVRYLVRYKQIDYLSVDHIRAYGTNITGNKEVDRMQAEQWITTMLPISELAEMHSNGVRLALVNYNDSKQIYEVISLHLNMWKDKIKYMVNEMSAPIEDLVKLDKLAVAVYEHAKYQFTREIVNNLFVSSMFGGRKSTIDQLFDMSKVAKAAPVLVEEKVIEQVDYSKTTHDPLFKEALRDINSIIRR